MINCFKIFFSSFQMIRFNDAYEWYEMTIRDTRVASSLWKVENFRNRRCRLHPRRFSFLPQNIVSLIHGERFVNIVTDEASFVRSLVKIIFGNTGNYTDARERERDSKRSSRRRKRIVLEFAALGCLVLRDEAAVTFILNVFLLNHGREAGISEGISRETFPSEILQN